MLRIYETILECLSELSPLIERITHHDPDLARQLKRASRSVALNEYDTIDSELHGSSFRLCPLSRARPLPRQRAQAEGADDQDEEGAVSRRQVLQHRSDEDTDDRRKEGDEEAVHPVRSSKAELAPVVPPQEFVKCSALRCSLDT